ncbi:MAG: LysR family transcriptional regulator [Candidatus Faecousia sp.]|nr:LysR family transcriptional regulator [Clostridiales bacterium]MDY6179725.1 LysR family transcriptional regulator [Candidatus Faecousia sp.]
MELKELEYIVAVAEEGSISRAAERLYLAQSSLSQYVARTEAELGVKLFRRTAGGVRPTAAGELYLRNARQMLLQYHQVRKQLTDLDAPMEGKIHFGISTFRGSYLFPKAMHLFRQEVPTVDVVLHEHDSIVLQRKIAAGELDMALVAFREDQWEEQGKLLMKDEVLLVANREHPVMEYVREGGGGPDRPWVELAEIAHMDFLLSSRSAMLGNIAEQMFQELGVEPWYVCGTQTASMSAALARRGLGIAFTYRSCVEESRDVIYLSIGKKRHYVNLALIYPPEGYRSRAIRAFESVLCRVLATEVF